MTSAPDGSLWVTVRATGEVVRVDPGLGKVVARISEGGEPYDVAVTGGSAWVSDRTHDRVTRIDAVTNLVTDTVHLPGLEPRDVEATSAGVWVIGSGEMALIDPVTGATMKRLPAARLGNLGSWPSLLVAGMANAGLQRVDPETGRFSAERRSRARQTCPTSRPPCSRPMAASGLPATGRQPCSESSLPGSARCRRAGS